ncbi:hypothetical protein [Bacillus paranthracis]|nr:hypothetical protein [Bacillus paranthracis]MCU5287979.1 hypothetical protein [Bacillus paranthracis]SME52447.1 hypothetical protein BACERE00176_05500 [Bacillus paranthracis]
MDHVIKIGEKPFAFFEGCINALILVLPFWLIVVFVIYVNL